MPSVAETWDSEISFSRIGSAPRRSCVARSWAEEIVNPPVMSAPLSAGIPSGNCLKSIDGTVISCVSSATAKCWFCFWLNGLLSWPRCAMSPVTFWKAFLPLPVNPNDTSGWPPWSELCCGLVIWLPNSATWSLSTKNWAVGADQVSGLVKLVGTAWSTTIPRGTVRIVPSFSVTPVGRPSSRSPRLSSGPASRQCCPGTAAVPLALAAAWQAALPGAPNMKYSGVDRELSDDGSGFCLAARLTESHRFWLPAPGLPGGTAPLADPWLIASALGSWTCSWLATVLPFGVSALASQS